MIVVSHGLDLRGSSPAKIGLQQAIAKIIDGALQQKYLSGHLSDFIKANDGYLEDLRLMNFHAAIKEPHADISSQEMIERILSNEKKYLGRHE